MFFVWFIRIRQQPSTQNVPDGVKKGRLFYSAIARRPASTRSGADGVARIFRVVTHVTEEQRGHKVRRRTTGRGMAAAGRRRGSDGMNAKLVRDPGECFNRNGAHTEG